MQARDTYLRCLGPLLGGNTFFIWKHGHGLEWGHTSAATPNVLSTSLLSVLLSCIGQIYDNAIEAHHYSEDNQD